MGRNRPPARARSSLRIDSTERYRNFLPNMPVTEQNEQSKGQPREACTIAVFLRPMTQSAVPSAKAKSGAGSASKSVIQGAVALCRGTPEASFQERFGTPA